MVVVPVQFTVVSVAPLFCLFTILLLSRTTTWGAVEKVKVLFTPLTAPLVGTSTVKPPPVPVTAIFATPAPPLVTVAPVVKSIVVTLTTGVTPSVTVSGLPEPPPLPAPVISIRELPRH